MKGINNNKKKKKPMARSKSAPKPHLLAARMGVPSVVNEESFSGPLQATPPSTSSGRAHRSLSTALFQDDHQYEYEDASERTFAGRTTSSSGAANRSSTRSMIRRSASLSHHATTTTITSVTSPPQHPQRRHRQSRTTSRLAVAESSGTTMKSRPSRSGSRKTTLQDVLSSSPTAQERGGSSSRSVTSMPAAANPTTTTRSTTRTQQQQQQQQQQHRSSSTLLSRTGTFEMEGFMQQGGHVGGDHNRRRPKNDNDLLEPSETELSCAFYDAHATPRQEQPSNAEDDEGADQDQRADWFHGNYHDYTQEEEDDDEEEDDYYDDEMPDDNYTHSERTNPDDWHMPQDDLVDLHLSSRGDHSAMNNTTTKSSSSDRRRHHGSIFSNNTTTSSTGFFRQRDRYAVDQTCNLMDTNNPDFNPSWSQTMRQRWWFWPFGGAKSGKPQLQPQQYGDRSMSGTSSRRGRDNSHRWDTAANRWDTAANPYGVDPNQPIGGGGIRRTWYLRLVLLLLGIVVVGVGIVTTVSSSSKPADKHGNNTPSRKDLVLAMLTEAEMASEQVLLESPPQSVSAKAFEWLVHYDPSDWGEDDTGGVLERWALASFYFGSYPWLSPDQVPNTNNNSTGAWRRQDQWMTKAPVCDWFGVQCAQDKQQTTRQQLVVTHLDLSDNNINTTLVEELKGLEHLRLLDLSNNQIHGRLEASILNGLGELEFLIMTNNSVTGALPNDGDRLTALQMLHLDTNQLTSVLPAMFLGSLTNLRSLKLQRNHFNDTLPTTLGGLVNLETLHLSENDISGPLPDVFDGLEKLTDLELHRNPIRSSIPESISKLTNLRRLALHMAGMSGTIPESLSALTRVDILLLHHNALIGPIPESFGQLTDVVELWLDHNFLYDAIPSSLGLLTNLKELMLEQNALEGSIPSELGDLQNLERLRVYENQMSGSSVPSQICDLRHQHNLKFLEADCSKKIQCACCTKCK